MFNEHKPTGPFRSRRRNRKRRGLHLSKLPFALLMRYLAQRFISFGTRPYRRRYDRAVEPAELRPAA